jgi:hypothetical protein
VDTDKNECPLLDGPGEAIGTLGDHISFWIRLLSLSSCFQGCNIIGGGGGGGGGGGWGLQLERQISLLRGGLGQFCHFTDHSLRIRI